MKELIKNNHYKIVKVELPAGANMPRHYATSEAFVMVEQGDALLICKDEKCELRPGMNVCIPSHEEHILKVIEEFKALIVLSSDAVIIYPAA